MVLILLGNGVVAGVLLKGSKAEGGGWIVITAGWAFAVMAGVFTAIACGSSDAHLNPAVTLASRRAPATSRKSDRTSSPRCGGDHRRRAGVAALLAALEGDTGWRAQTRLLLHRACHPPIHPESGE